MQRTIAIGGGLLVTVLALVLVMGLGVIEFRHRGGVKRANEAFDSYLPPRMVDFGETRTLRITPLVDFHTARRGWGIPTAFPLEARVWALCQTPTGARDWVEFDVAAGHLGRDGSSSFVVHSL